MNLFNTYSIARLKNSITFALPLTPKNKVTILNNPFNEVEVRGYGFKRVLFFDMSTTTMTQDLKLTLSSGVVHGLKCRIKGANEVCTIVGYDFDLNIVKLKSRLFNLRCNASGIELLMHPISRLTEPILPDGKIPIVELAKMAFKYYNWELDETNKWPTAKCDEGYFQFWDNCFYWFSGGIISAPNQLALFDQLDAWHINYRGVEAVEIIND